MRVVTRPVEFSTTAAAASAGVVIGAAGFGADSLIALYASTDAFARRNAAD